ncbi:DUF3592 domain-containing protein [Herbiconiux ginsengi]|uniref:DUF3592 domain-containing protein n=1 Tax=Herbiconiux ginsengi TaxID=381665 RepID=A0A1H3PUY1_9MICO|nr:DUF3592 domain-containing protein [Herbiconiux ginsengi]SDZ04751.1 hypothetical protein SAMN05216554_2112 [Herbiconiux ginsengi]
MSTIDPRIARAEKANRPARSAGRVAITAVLGIVHVGLWALAGYGFGETFDTMRLMAINQVGDGWDSRFDGTLPLLFIVGVTLGAILGFALTGVSGRVLGLAGATLLPLFTGATGIAIGLALFYPEWTPAESYGQLLGFMAGDAPTPWDTSAWVQYWLPVWLPIVFGVIALVLLVVVVLAASGARRKAKRMAERVTTGRRVAGVVTEVLPTGVEISGMPRLQFTVTFRDLAGVDRWVTKKGNFSPAALPRAGDAAVVWFDPLNPGSEKDIVVGLGPEAAAAAS